MAKVVKSDINGVTFSYNLYLYFVNQSWQTRHKPLSHETEGVTRGKSLTRTPLRIGVDIVKNIVEKHSCFVLVVNWPQNRRRVQITTYNYNQQQNCGRFKKPAKGAL